MRRSQKKKQLFPWTKPNMSLSDITDTSFRILQNSIMLRPTGFFFFFFFSKKQLQMELRTLRENSDFFQDIQLCVTSALLGHFVDQEDHENRLIYHTKQFCVIVLFAFHSYDNFGPLIMDAVRIIIFVKTVIFICSIFEYYKKNQVPFLVTC